VQLRELRPQVQALVDGLRHAGHAAATSHADGGSTSASGSTALVAVERTDALLTLEDELGLGVAPSALKLIRCESAARCRARYRRPCSLYARALMLACAPCLCYAVLMRAAFYTDLAAVSMQG
jgi:hypothetical protein